MDDREQAAERLLAAYEAVEQWWAQDFKRSRVPANLTYTQYSILGAAGHGEPMTISSVAERLGLSNPTVVRAVDALERKGLVERRRSEEDGRVVHIVTTQEGRRIRRQLDRTRRERLAALLAMMPVEGVDCLVRGLEGMAHAADGGESC